MPRKTFTTLAATATFWGLLPIFPLEAQPPHPLVGTWTIEFERGRRVENDVVTPIMGTGKLVIVQSGDSLLATLESSPRPDGSPPPPSTFGGRASGGGVVFVQKQVAQITVNGEASSREMLLTWTLQAGGDVLTGTLARELPMMPEPLPPTPVKGTRTKG